MKYLASILLLSCCISCTSDKTEQQQFFAAASKEGAALLSLKIEKNQFYGHYKVRYSDRIIDSGAVRGIVIGDTLRGRFSYISYGGSKEVKPFLLLKRGDTLKLGTGAAYTYMKIPYYAPGSITFKTSNFQFLPISSEKFKATEAKMKR